ncbi:hypothetical protein ABZY19_34455 [Streptomyces sp. NPDC006475]|uniref:hypothetical protein n=1 Tax=Streptomyces sp. NPDC006475 TaxID=3155719 RepID=UPI0033AE415B
MRMALTKAHTVVAALCEVKIRAAVLSQIPGRNGRSRWTLASPADGHTIQGLVAGRLLYVRAAG